MQKIYPEWLKITLLLKNTEFLVNSYETWLKWLAHEYRLVHIFWAAFLALKACGPKDMGHPLVLY